MGLLTLIRSVQELRVNAEDSEVPPKSLLKQIEFLKKQGVTAQMWRVLKDLNGWGVGRVRVCRVTTSVL